MPVFFCSKEFLSKSTLTIYQKKLQSNFKQRINKIYIDKISYGHCSNRSEWLNNGLNASAAYKALHPYDIGYSDYILGLKEGLAAMKFNELTGEKVPDYRTRLEFHRILGKLLGF